MSREKEILKVAEILKAIPNKYLMKALEGFDLADIAEHLVNSGIPSKDGFEVDYLKVLKWKSEALKELTEIVPKDWGCVEGGI